MYADSVVGLGRRGRPVLSRIHEEAHEIAWLRRRGLPVRSRFPRIARLPETACLIADVHMPRDPGSNSMNTCRSTIPTILVTAYPDDVDRARALNDGRLLPS